MNEPVTMHTGPLGSTIHVLRADAETIVELEALDWNRQFRRVCLDPVRGVITLSREAVVRVVRRRQRTSVRVREEEGAYSQDPREPVATGESRQGPGRTESSTHHG